MRRERAGEDGRGRGGLGGKWQGRRKEVGQKGRGGKKVRGRGEEKV